MTPVIGIDLGTTFSGAAVYRNGKSEVIPNKEGQQLTPSYVVYNSRTLNVFVGTTADEKGVKEINNFLFDIKRIIGRKYDDIYIQELKKSPEYRFKIVRGDNDTAEIEVIHDNVTVNKTPEQASSELLKYLRESASEYLGAEVTEAVVSIPAHFSNAQRKATRAAAELAGLKVLKLITEPVAAAIHYSEDKLGTEGTLLVFDFGGGTLDVSIIKVDKKLFKVKSVEGDTFLGGRDFDQILLRHFKADLIRRFGPEIFTDRLLKRVKDACSRLKVMLSFQQDYSLTINCIGGDEDREYTLEMSRTKFEQLTDSLYERAIHLVKKCINEAGMSKSDIDEVVLVGGTTRIPKIRTMLSDYFKDKKIKIDLNPDVAVALGAAVQAAMIKEKFKHLEKYQVTEVTPLSLGLEYDVMTVMIKKNTPLPFKSPPVIGVTRDNDQKSMIFKIYEGERKMCKFNNLLGSFTLNDLPPGKAGAVKCEMIFFLEEDGILEVEAYETSTKNKNKVAVTIGEYRLCDNKIKNAVEDAERNKEEDDIFEAFCHFKSTVYQECNHIIYDLGKIPTEIDRKFVQEKCKEFKSYCEIIEYTKIDDLRTKYVAFSTAVKGILGTYIDVKLNSDLMLVQPRLGINNWLVSSLNSINLSDSLKPYNGKKGSK